MKKQRLSFEDLNQRINSIAGENQVITRQYGITIENVVITGNALFTTYSPVIHFKECVFLKRFTFLNCHIQVTVYFTHCYFFGDLGIMDSLVEEKLHFTNCKIYGNFILSGGKIDALYAYVQVCHKLIIGQLELRYAEIGGGEPGQIRELIILNTNSISEKLQIANQTIQKLSLGEISNTCEVHLFNLHVNSFLINKVRNNGFLKLINVKGHPVTDKRSFFSINESNLGKAEFFQIDFSSFDEVNIKDSVLVECIFVNTTWSKNINSFNGEQMDNFMADRMIIHGGGYRETPYQLSNKRETYKQIKYALSRQGDYINEQFFHGLEMNVYNKTLKNNSRNFFTKVILKLSYLTSDYGQSIIRPFIFLLLTNGAFFLLLASFGQIPNVHIVKPENGTLNGLGNAVGQFLKYNNPLRKTDDAITSWVLVTDYIMRIISSYAIYNIIRASRRFIK